MLNIRRLVRMTSAGCTHGEQNQDDIIEAFLGRPFVSWASWKAYGMHLSLHTRKPCVLFCTVQSRAISLLSIAHCCVAVRGLVAGRYASPPPHAGFSQRLRTPLHGHKYQIILYVVPTPTKDATKTHERPGKTTASTGSPGDPTHCRGTRVRAARARHKQ